MKPTEEDIIGRMQAEIEEIRFLYQDMLKELKAIRLKEQLNPVPYMKLDLNPKDLEKT